MHARPGKGLRWALALIPFLLVALAYGIASDIRHRANPADKVLPTPVQMIDAVKRMAFTADPRSGQYLLWNNTGAAIIDRLVDCRRPWVDYSLEHGALSWLACHHQSVHDVCIDGTAAVDFADLVISLGVDELAKVTLIIIGIFPLIARDISNAVQRLPKEQLTKALTLGASQLELTYRIVLPQIWLRLIETTRLSLGATWLFLIAAEEIAASEGLGTGFFLVRRYLAMDVIFPYVLWITALGFSMDGLLRLWLQQGFDWYVAGQKHERAKLFADRRSLQIVWRKTGTR